MTEAAVSKHKQSQGADGKEAKAETKVKPDTNPEGKDDDGEEAEEEAVEKDELVDG